MTEVLFSYKVDNKIVNGNIDLVMVNKDEVIIIDYKTDSKEEDHSVQLGFYKKVIEQSIHKDKNVTTYISTLKNKIASAAFS